MKKQNKGLYIHIPFCVKKCRYCAFNSYENMYDYAQCYVDTLINHIKSFDNEKIDTIYIGGGTPSSIDEKLIVKLMENVYQHFDVDKNAEITIESNPKTIDEKKLTSYLECGINRISIGSQSFDNDQLKMLGRIHTAYDTEKSVQMAREAGFNNINLDVIYALFNQSEKSLIATLEKTLSLNPEHISCYGLMVEEGTPLFEDVKNKIYSPQSDETYLKMYELISDTLSKKGFLHYEISNFSKESKYMSQHNLKYWHGDEYIGVGAGASGYINGKRYSNECDVLSYINDFSKQYDIEILDDKAKMSEFMILNLRLLNEGANIDRFKQIFGKDMLCVFGDKLIYHLEKTKMLERTDGQIVLSKKAYYISNAVLCDFLLD